MHVYLGDVFVGAGFEGQRQRAGAVCHRGRGHIVKAVDAVHFALDDREHRFFDGGGAGAGIGDVDVDGRRADVRVLLYRQSVEREQAAEHDENGDDPGEDRSVNKKSGHDSPGLVRAGRFGGVSGLAFRRSGGRGSGLAVGIDHHRRDMRRARH